MRKHVFIIVIFIMQALLLSTGCRNTETTVISKRYENGKKYVESKFRGTGTTQQLIEEITYDPQGRRRHTVQFNKKVADYVFYHENGSIAREFSMVNNRFEGFWTEWNASGSLQCRKFYKNGLPHGPQMLVFKYHRFFKQNDMEYDNGVPVGKWVAWINDRPEEIKNYQKGKLDGPWLKWYPNGQLQTSATYSEGRLSGTYTQWYDTGGKKEEGLYHHGLFAGVWKMWDEKGNLIKEKKYNAPPSPLPSQGDIK